MMDAVDGMAGKGEEDNEQFNSYHSDKIHAEDEAKKEKDSIYAKK